MSLCRHKTLCYHGAENPARARYAQSGKGQLQRALGSTNKTREKRKVSKQLTSARVSKESDKSEIELPAASTFPAPLVLPGDELFCDPEYPPQSVQDWVEGPERKKVTSKRRTIYVIGPPMVSDELHLFDDLPTSSTSRGLERPQKPLVQDVVQYLEAFYYGMKLKVPEKAGLEFTAWDNVTSTISTRQERHIPSFIALSTGSEAIRIRCRRAREPVLSCQLNLNDLLDAAISILPKDAYALLMLVHQDLYEDDDDDFCCGRAYGGSSVAVVSTARYRPDLDKEQNIDIEHVWPASHCQEFLERLSMSGSVLAGNNETKREDAAMNQRKSALEAGVKASMVLHLPSSSSEQAALWLGRVCKTASHELGHCFGIDHCTYYACVMQGTAHLAEDPRQPPYLCLIDLSKVTRATGCDEQERYKALLGFCEKWKHDRMFAAFGAWIQSRLSCYEES